jgi:predicted phage terminase large subunit-like protein
VSGLEKWEELGLTQKQYEALQYQARLELARRDFWEFCKIKAPDFYMEDRTYLKNICQELQEFYEDDEARVMILNEPPRHGKSRTGGLFAQWVFGKNPSEKIITGSYNEQLSTTFSRGVRNDISERKASKDKIVYSDLFPNTRIKRGNSAANLWSLEGQHISYLATSPGGTVTGFGATLMIIDDIVKNADEAMNETVLESHWQWFTNTMLSRLEKGGKVIIIATRWNTKDLSGRAIDHYKSIGVPVKLITEKALQDDGTMLCEGVLDRQAYDLIVKTMGREIVEANYNQQPIDLVGRLYNVGFQTYKSLPVDENGQSVVEEICAYIDTADQGADYLCCIIYGLYRQQAYVLDVYFTKEGMEITEPEVAKRLYEYKVNKAYIESNSGGRGFGRSVERILREKHHYYKCYIDLFTQTRNKKARILSSATWCQNNIKFPIGWEVNYSEFYGDVMGYQKEGKMSHDDAEDCLAGIYDKVGKGNLFSFT